MPRFRRRRAIGLAQHGVCRADVDVATAAHRRHRVGPEGFRFTLEWVSNDVAANQLVMHQRSVCGAE